MKVVPIFFFALILLQTTWHVMADVPPAAAVATSLEDYKDDRISLRVPKGAKVTAAKSGNWDSYTIHMASRGNQTLVLRIGGDAESLEISRQRASAARKADVARIGVEEVQGETRFVLKEVSELTEYHMESNVILAYAFKQEMHLKGRAHPGWGSVGFGSVDGVSVMCQLSGSGHEPEGDFMVAMVTLCEIKKR